MGETARAPITTILFTDLVDSTTLMQRVGDERARTLFAAHHRLLADAVAAHGGSELQWLGDGLMVASARPRTLYAALWRCNKQPRNYPWPNACGSVLGSMSAR